MAWQLTTSALVLGSVGVPERTFGTQLVEDSEWERPEVLPFSTYAACRILDTTPESDTNSGIYEALTRLAAFYLRADMGSICECINEYKLNELLYTVAKVEQAFTVSPRTSSDRHQLEKVASATPREGDDPQMDNTAQPPTDGNALLQAAELGGRAASEQEESQPPGNGHRDEDDSASQTSDAVSVSPLNSPQRKPRPRARRSEPQLPLEPLLRSSSLRRSHSLHRARSLPRARSLKDVAGRAGSRLNLLQEEESGQPALRRSHSGRSSRDDDAPTPQDKVMGVNMRRQEDDYQHTVKGETVSQRPGTELHTVKGMVGALMHELEVILHEYLSFNWDRLDDILAANKHLLEPEGPALPSPRPRDSAETAHSNDGQVCTLVGNVHHGLHPAS
eukprot:jgi/Astpho2/4865/Aster-05800